MAVLIDSYTITDDYQHMASQWYWGQSFLNPDEITLDSMQFYVANRSADGTVYAQIYAHTGTFGVDGIPTGAPLATSVGVLATDLEKNFPTFAWQEFVFTGANRILLEASTHYCVVLYWDGTHGFSGDSVYFRDDGTTKSHAGIACWKVGEDWYEHSSTDMAFKVYGDSSVYGTGEFTGAGEISADGLVVKFATGSFGGIGTLSGNGIVLATRFFIKEPKVIRDPPIATHVIVRSPTNEATANTTPEVEAEVMVERLVNIPEGDETACQVVADELILKWGREQVSIVGIVDLIVTLLFKQKVYINIPQSRVDGIYILQRKEHSITSSTTSVVFGDIILSDEELIARILEGIEN